MAKTILLMTKNNEKKEAIAAVCKSLGMELKEISQVNINSPIGGFLGMSLNSRSAKMAPALYNPPELMIFSGLMDKDLDEFLVKYRSSGIEPISYKGMITPYNITWSPYEFILEYEKEKKELEEK